MRGGELLRGIERRQRGLDQEQEKFQKTIRGFLDSDTIKRMRLPHLTQALGNVEGLGDCQCGTVSSGAAPYARSLKVTMGAGW